MKSLAAILILAMIWAVGLLAFAARVERSTPAREPERADGIVALTGPSTERIEAAMRLLEQRKARRMLVSGVNPEATREDIRGVARAPGRLYDCCVDLGFRAENTVGNARETAAWAKSKGYKSLIVVTSDYHMPRSLLELKGALPGVKFQAYPIRTEELEAGRWFRSGRAMQRMAMEYCKYIVILARETILGLGPKDDGETPAADKKPAPKAKPA